MPTCIRTKEAQEMHEALKRPFTKDKRGKKKRRKNRVY